MSCTWGYPIDFGWNVAQGLLTRFGQSLSSEILSLCSKIKAIFCTFIPTIVIGVRVCLSIVNSYVFRKQFNDLAHPRRGPVTCLCRMRTDDCNHSHMPWFFVHLSTINRILITLPNMMVAPIAQAKKEGAR